MWARELLNNLARDPKVHAIRRVALLAGTWRDDEDEAAVAELKCLLRSSGVLRSHELRSLDRPEHG
jgi:hypothetical protein